MIPLSSRRKFLRSTAGSVSLTWGGLRMLAGPPGSLSSPLVRPEESKPFIYGSAFYRPPNPPPSQRRQMLKAIAEEYKFNVIRIYSSWVYHNPEPDRFDFEELEEVMRYCDEFSLR